MKNTVRTILQLAILFGVAFALIRFFPLFVRLAEAAALGVREFWWAILVLALGGWLIWVLRQRNPDR